MGWFGEEEKRELGAEEIVGFIWVTIQTNEQKL